MAICRPSVIVYRVRSALADRLVPVGRRHACLGAEVVALACLQHGLERLPALGGCGATSSAAASCRARIAGLAAFGSRASATVAARRASRGPATWSECAHEPAKELHRQPGRVEPGRGYELHLLGLGQYPGHRCCAHIPSRGGMARRQE